MKSEGHEPVDLGETSPGTEDLGVGNLDKVDLVLGAEGLDELDVLGCKEKKGSTVSDEMKRWVTN